MSKKFFKITRARDPANDFIPLIIRTFFHIMCIKFNLPDRPPDRRSYNTNFPLFISLSVISSLPPPRSLTRWLIALGSWIISRILLLPPPLHLSSIPLSLLSSKASRSFPSPPSPPARKYSVVDFRTIKGGGRIVI